jgi:hypothetical protein
MVVEGESDGVGHNNLEPDAPQSIEPNAVKLLFLL